MCWARLNYLKSKLDRLLFLLITVVVAMVLCVDNNRSVSGRNDEGLYGSWMKPPNYFIYTNRRQPYKPTNWTQEKSTIMVVQPPKVISHNLIMTLLFCEVVHLHLVITLRYYTQEAKTCYELSFPPLKYVGFPHVSLWEHFNDSLD